MDNRQNLSFLYTVLPEIEKLKKLMFQQLINLGDTPKKRELILSLVLGNGDFSSISDQLGLSQEYQEYRSCLDTIPTHNTTQIAELIDEYMNFLIVKIIASAQ